MLRGQKRPWEQSRPPWITMDRDTWVWADHRIAGIFSLAGDAGAGCPSRSFLSDSSSFRAWELRPYILRRLSPREATDTTISRIQTTVSMMQNARNKFIIMFRYSLHLSVFQSESSLYRTVPYPGSMLDCKGLHVEKIST